MKHRILIVDDNPEIQADFRKILQPKRASTELDDMAASLFGVQSTDTGFDCELDYASQGEIAVQMVQDALKANRPYGMAFVDVRMPPGMDGVQTIAQIRRIDPAMGFTICTAYSDYTPEEEKCNTLSVNSTVHFDPVFSRSRPMTSP